MKYLAVQQLQYSGQLGDVDARLSRLADALYDIEESDQAIEDPDLVARLTDGYLDVQMVVEATDPAEAITKALRALQAAIQAVGDSTPGWETSRAVMHAAPADETDRLFVEA